MRTFSFIKPIPRAICNTKGIFAASFHRDKDFAPAVVSGMKDDADVKEAGTYRKHQSLDIRPCVCVVYCLSNLEPRSMGTQTI